MEIDSWLCYQSRLCPYHCENFEVLLDDFGAILTICSPGSNIQINPLKQPHSETLIIYQICCFFMGNWHENDDEIKFDPLHATMGWDKLAH